MKISISKLWKIRAVCNAFTSTNTLTKFIYACKRNADAADSVLKQADKDIENLKVLHCAEKDGQIVRNEKGGIVIDKNKLKSFDEAVEKILAGEVEFEPYKAQSFKEIETDINILELFNGVIIDVNIEEMLN